MCIFPVFETIDLFPCSDDLLKEEETSPSLPPPPPSLGNFGRRLDIQGSLAALTLSGAEPGLSTSIEEEDRQVKDTSLALAAQCLDQLQFQKR